jgi:hypothetical protein
MKAEKPTGLALLREPFPPHQISKLPKPTKAQTDAVKSDFKSGIRCDICGQWHHPKVVHLDYVGHAALTDRLLDCDPNWDWQPLAISPAGIPVMDENGGMWIKLTVCNVTRLGYGHPDGKRGGDAVKEVIGDALRNAAMRFGAALDLWHKGDLHAEAEEPAEPQPKPAQEKAPATPAQIADRLIQRFAGFATVADLTAFTDPDQPAGQAWDRLAKDEPAQSARVKDAFDKRMVELS